MKPATIEEECQRSLINNRLETLSEEIDDLRDIIVLKANDTSRAGEHVLPVIAERLDEIEAELKRHWQTAIRVGVTTTER
jgi:hypothetical protein